MARDQVVEGQRLARPAAQLARAGLPLPAGEGLVDLVDRLRHVPDGGFFGAPGNGGRPRIGLRMPSGALDVIGNKGYNGRMVRYETLQADRRRFLALTGLTLPEFQRLLTAFPRAYQRIYPASQTTEGRPRRRSVGGGRKGSLHRPEDQLLLSWSTSRPIPFKP